MTNDEKLKHFYDSTVEETGRQAARETELHKARLKEELAEHRRTMRQNAESEVRAESDSAAREIRKALATEQISLRRALTAVQNELRDRLFEEVKEKLSAFMASPEYDAYLYKKIMEARKFAGKDEIRVYLTKADEERAASLATRTGIPLQIAEELFLGGIQAVIPEKNILIDNSFQEGLETLKREFKFDGGLIHEHNR